MSEMHVEGTVDVEVLERWLDAGQKAAAARKIATVMAEGRRILKARIYREGRPSGGAAQDQEMAALADPRYEEHVRLMADAQEAAELAELDARIAEAEWRRQLSNGVTRRNIAVELEGKPRR